MQNPIEKAQPVTKAPRFYSLRNYLSVATHYAAAAGLAAASYAFAQPWAIIAASALVVPVSIIILKKAKKEFETNLVEHKKSYNYAPRLGKTIEDLYKKSGLKSENYPVYDFKKVKPSADKKPSRFNLMQKIPNAAAFSLGKPIIMISTPLLKLLDDEEEKAVLAHEFAHINSKHIAVKLPIAILNGVSALSNNLTFIGASMSAGFMKWLGVQALVIATNIGLKKIAPHKDLLNADEKNLSVKDIYKKKKAERPVDLFTAAVGLGALAYINPAIPALFATMKAISISSKVLTGTFSRSAEYQADKGAVALDASPLALITSLRKITALMERSRQNAWGNEPVPQPGVLQKAWKNATATHPTLENRIARLSDLARKQGYDEETIRQAATGPLDISEAEDVPYDVLKAMAAAL